MSSFAMTFTRDGVATTEHVLQCDMHRNCTESVTMIDDGGYTYCTVHGLQRRSSWTRCRKLTPIEMRKLLRGEQIAKY